MHDRARYARTRVRLRGVTVEERSALAKVLMQMTSASCTHAAVPHIPSVATSYNFACLDCHGHRDGAGVVRDPAGGGRASRHRQALCRFQELHGIDSERACGSMSCT
jgi:hypothetical protein